MNSFKVLDSFPEISRNVEFLEEEGKTVIIMAVGLVPYVILSLEEEELTKPEARDVIEFLRGEMNMKIYMITGDNKHSALKVAAYLNIDPDNVTYQAYPETKKQVVEDL